MLCEPQVGSHDMAAKTIVIDFWAKETAFAALDPDSATIYVTIKLKMSQAS
jgi:hypothetical protein